jgi:hypothetical protein
MKKHIDKPSKMSFAYILNPQISFQKWSICVQETSKHGHLKECLPMINKLPLQER